MQTCLNSEAQESPRNFTYGNDPTTKVVKLYNKEIKQLREQEENLYAVQQKLNRKRSARKSQLSNIKFRDKANPAKYYIIKEDVSESSSASSQSSMESQRILHTSPKK